MIDRKTLAAALDLYDSVGWADDDNTPDFWRDAYDVLAQAARERLAQLQYAALIADQWGHDHPSYDEMGQ